MPRRPRIKLDGVPIHVIQRGNNHCACFLEGRDYGRYLWHLEELAEKFACAIHADVLMRNHVHLLVTPEQSDGVSLLMKRLGQRHTQYVNRTYDRSGTLWQGRFRSCVAEEESYVLCCYRYIELNPMRAQMVEHPGDHHWSSYRVNGEGAYSCLVAPHELHLRLGQTDDTRRAAYRSLFRTSLGDTVLDEIRRATNGNLALGTASFQRQLELQPGRRATHRRAGRPTKLGSDHDLPDPGKSWSDPN